MLVLVLGACSVLACRSAPEAEPAPDPEFAPGPEVAAEPSALPAPIERAAAAAQPVASAAAAAPSSAKAELPPLGGAWLEALDAPDRGPVVTLPLGARAATRLIVGVHGAGDRPEWSCGGWRLASGASSFVLCPRGSRMDAQRFAWASSSSIEQALDAALAALGQRYGAYLDQSAAIYAGFSQGATLAEPLLRARAQQFPIAILAEGGYAVAQSPAFARAYQAAGGRRVVLVCGSRACFASASRAQPSLERAGLEVLVVGDEKAGHNLNDRMQKALQAAWPRIAAPLRPMLASP